MIEFYDDGTAQRVGRVHVGGVMYDDAGTEVSEVVLKDRIHMSTEGIFVVVLTVQRGTGRILSSPDIISRGFIYLRDSEDLINAIRQYIRQKTARVYASRRVDMEGFKAGAGLCGSGNRSDQRRFGCFGSFYAASSSRCAG